MADHFLQQLEDTKLRQDVLGISAIIVVVSSSILLSIPLAAPRCVEPHFKWTPPPLHENAYGELSVLEGAVTHTSGGFVLLLVDTDVYYPLYHELLSYADSLVNEGLGVETYGFERGSPESIRGLLLSSYSRGMIGAILIGDIPTAWFEIETDGCYERFPIDLFYMDIDGEWRDITIPNGVYDLHLGQRQPEIWIGRLAPPVGGEEGLRLLQSYFERNNAYRTLKTVLPGRALLYVDDDWSYWTGSFASALDDVFEVTAVGDREETNAANYAKLLQEGYSLIQVMAHSYELGSGFTVPVWRIQDGYEQRWVDGLGFADKKVESISSYEVRDLGAKAFFYNLFACSAAKFTSPDYLGGWYLFGNSYGLAAIGSTKAGSMLYFEEFYPLWKNRNLGSAFKEWLAERIEAEQAGDWYGKDWFYGMSLLGDPTLMLRGKRDVAVDLQNLSGSTRWGSIYLKVYAYDPMKTIIANMTKLVAGLEAAQEIMFELPPNTATVEVLVELNSHPTYTKVFAISSSQSLPIPYQA